MSREQAWAVEEACLNAWPCGRQLLRGRWLIRAAGGPSRRLNSVNPLPAHRYDPAAVEDEAARIYAGLGRPLTFRVPALAGGLAEALAARGYTAHDETRTLFRPMDDAPPAKDAAVVSAAAPDEAWLALRRALNGGGAEADGAMRAVVATLMLPCRFAALRTAEGTLAIAYGAIDRDILVIEAVGTAPAARGRGYARRVVGDLMGWGRAVGARSAALQVLSANAAGRALYARLGFDADLYSYSYFSRLSAVLGTDLGQGALAATKSTSTPTSNAT